MRKKEEALNAIDTARAMLNGMAPLQGLQLRQLRGILEFARETVAELEELKRPRRATHWGETPPAPKEGRDA